MGNNLALCLGYNASCPEAVVLNEISAANEQACRSACLSVGATFYLYEPYANPSVNNCQCLDACTPVYDPLLPSSALWSVNETVGSSGIE